MITFKKTSHLVIATIAFGLSARPVFADSKMMDSKMSGGKMMDHKMGSSKMMGSKMNGGKMMSDKAVCAMCKMSASESKTYMNMSPAEKALFMKHMDKMGGGKMMGGKMSGGKMMEHKMGGKM